MRYIALLRGINVGGNTMIKMAELKSSLEGLGFKDVTTYINSGNLAFDVSSPHVSKGSSQEHVLVDQIENGILKDFTKQVPVMVRKQKEIERILKNNPFDGQFESHKEMHVLFMKAEMPQDKQKQLLEWQTADERFVVRGREIYCHLRLGVADSVLGKGLIERKLKTPTTARNWRTVEKLAEL